MLVEIANVILFSILPLFIYLYLSWLSMFIFHGQPAFLFAKCTIGINEIKAVREEALCGVSGCQVGYTC